MKTWGIHELRKTLLLKDCLVPDGSTFLP